MENILPEDRNQVLPKVYNDSDQLARAHTFLMKQLDSVKEDHRNRSQKWTQWDASYRLVDPQRPEEGSAIVDPEIQVIVDTLVANEVEAFLSQDPPFKFQGTEENDEEQAELMTDYIADSLRRIKIREKFERTIRQKKIFGTAFVKTPYIREIEKRRLRRITDMSFDAKGNKKFKTKVEEVDFFFMDDTDWEPVSIFDLYLIGKGSTIEDHEGVIQIFERSYDELLSKKAMKNDDGEQVGIYYNLDDVAPVDDRKLKIAEYWGKIPMSIVTGNELDRFKKFEGVITAAIEFSDNDNNKDILKNVHAQRTGELFRNPNDRTSNQPTGGIRLQENPFWDNSRPYLSCPETPIDNEIYGVGVIEILVEKAQELNTTIRQVMDNKTLQLLNPTIEDVNAGIQRNLRLVRNPRIKANDINGIKPLPIQDFSTNGYRAILQIKDDMRRASGATEGVQGVPVKGEQSATEFAAVQQQAGVRIKSKIRLTDERLFKPFIERSYRNAMQFVTAQKMIRVHGVKGSNFVPVSPEDIWGTFDVVTKGVTEMENNIIMANKYIQFLQIASNIPGIANVPFILQKVWVKLGLPESESHQVILAGISETQSDIEAEIELMKIGQRVNVKPTQNHTLHIQMKTQAFSDLLQNGLTTFENTQAFRENIDGHAQMLATQAPQAAEAPGIPGQPQQPLFNELETPNPQEENVGPSAQGTGLSGI